MKRILKDYFTFSRKERTAVIILLLLIVSCMALPYFYRVKQVPPVLNKALIDFVAQSKTGANTKGRLPEGAASLYNTAGTAKVLQPSLFMFDPNTVSAEGWNRLGLPERTIRTILNYRTKGGRFRVPDDLRKIWGVSKEEADRLIPFVRIAALPAYYRSVDKYQVKKQPKGPGIIDINTATREDWEALPGIGEVLAARIITYRERTGGFSDLSQLKKTYGISDSVFAVISQYLTAAPAAIPKLDLNTATVTELQMRTGIPDAVARSIVLYRKQYGPFLSVAGLKKIVFLTDSLYLQVARHVKVN